MIGSWPFGREIVRRRRAKELGLWRVALAFGFVFDVDPFVTALVTTRQGTEGTQ